MSRKPEKAIRDGLADHTRTVSSRDARDVRIGAELLLEEAYAGEAGLHRA
jgi:hypothetical protein